MAHRDYEEFIDSLNEYGVRYLIVGAHAVGFHVRPRFTKDIDIFVEPIADNARRVLKALRRFFGGAEIGYTVADLISPDTVLQIGVAPVRIDLLTQLDGIESFGVAWQHRVPGKFGAVDAHYLSIDDLIAAKEAAGRPQDRSDLRALRRLKTKEEQAARPGPPTRPTHPRSRRSPRR
jgi:predicted nucleotidyltransferase